MKDIIIGFSLLWLLPFSYITAKSIIEQEKDIIKLKKEVKKCLKSSNRS